MSAFGAVAVVAVLAICVIGLLRLGVPEASNPFSGGGRSPVQLGVPQLESGACLSYSPAAGANGKAVFVDAGHGGPDSGGVGTVNGQNVQEKDVTLAVSLKLRDLLTSRGYRVILARTRDSTVMKLAPSDVDGGVMTPDAIRRDIETRIACANASKAAALLAVHFNALDDPSASGTETFYDALRPFVANSKRLATDLQASLVGALGITDLGVQTDDRGGVALTAQGAAYGHLLELGPPSPGYVDRPSQIPGALVEPLFLTNASDAAIVVAPSGRDRIAGALAAGIDRYMSGT